MSNYLIQAEFRTNIENGISTSKNISRTFQQDEQLTATFFRKILDDISYELISNFYDKETGKLNMESITIQLWKEPDLPADPFEIQTENCCQEDCGCKDFTTNNIEDFPSAEELTQALDEVIDLAENDDVEDYLK